jgi:hypothetical protein
VTVPLYFHIPVVLAFLVLQGSTVYWALRRIRDLEAALLAKKVLLGPTGVLAHNQHLVAGETLTFRDDNGNRLEITTASATHLDVKVYVK